MLLKKKKFDKESFKPVLHKSICTGEAVLGFKDINSGKFYDICLAKNERDIMKFCREYGVKKEAIGEDW